MVAAGLLVHLQLVQLTQMHARTCLQVHKNVGYGKPQVMACKVAVTDVSVENSLANSTNCILDFY